MNEVLRDVDFAASGPCATLRAAGLGFIDVGVRGGVHPIVEPIASATSVLAFEPDLEESARLRALYVGSSVWPDVTVEAVGLAERDGRATLHRCSASTNDSLLPINAPFIDRYRMDRFHPAGATEVEVSTLDAVLARRPDRPRWGELLKLDTQATELQILAGARETLRTRTVALIVEVWWCQPYAGQKLFSEVELFLRGLGFSCYGVSMHYRSRKLFDKRRHVVRERPLWSDALFLKDPLPGGPVPVTLDERGLHALFTSATLLGLHDFALELAHETWATGAERARLEAFLRRRSHRPRWRAVLDALGLAGRVLLRPGRANVTVGKFVDERRDLCSYEEVP